MSKETGGQAFPRQDSRYDGQGLVMWQDKGMTLRDYFAAKAMEGILSNRGMIDNVTPDSAKWVAREAYQVADAMLAARSQ